MKIHTIVLNEDGSQNFEGEDQFDIDELFKLAKSREQLSLNNGKEWTAGAVPFFGGEVVKAVDSGDHQDVTRAIIKLVMSTWLYESLYCGITAADYRGSDMQFSITHDGMVTYTRNSYVQRLD